MVVPDATLLGEGAVDGVPRWIVVDVLQGNCPVHEGADALSNTPCRLWLGGPDRLQHNCRWRRERDSNPRGSSTPPTRLAGGRTRPLCDPSSNKANYSKAAVQPEGKITPGSNAMLSGWGISQGREAIDKPEMEPPGLFQEGIDHVLHKQTSSQSKSKCQDRGDASWLWRPGR